MTTRVPTGEPNASGAGRGPRRGNAGSALRVADQGRKGIDASMRRATSATLRATVANTASIVTGSWPSTPAS